MTTELDCPACQCTYNEPLQLDGCAHRMCKQCVRSWTAQMKDMEARALEDSIDLLGLTDLDVATLARGQQLDFTERCAFCQGVENDHDDLVFCSRCDLAVHQGCYHITRLPEEDWYCEPCEDARKAEAKKGGAAGGKKGGKAAAPPQQKTNNRRKKGTSSAHQQSKTTQKCCVCSNRDDRALKRVENSSDYIHLSCASFLTGPEFVDQFEATPVACVDDIHAQWFRQNCMFCSGDGATVQCQFEKCVKTYHVPCGLRNGCLFSLKDMGEEGMYRDSTCPKHRQHMRDVAHKHDKKLMQKQRKAAIAKARRSGKKKNGRNTKKPPVGMQIEMPCPVCRCVSKIAQDHPTMGLTLDAALHAKTQQHRAAHPDEEDELAKIIARYSASKAHDGESDASSEDEAIHHRGITPAAAAARSHSGGGAASRNTPIRSRSTPKSNSAAVTSTSTTPQAPFSPPPLTSAAQTALRAERRANGIKAAAAATAPLSGSGRTAAAAAASTPPSGRGPPKPRGGVAALLSPSSLSRLSSPSSEAHLRAHAAKQTTPTTASGRKLEPRAMDFDGLRANSAAAAAPSAPCASSGPSVVLPSPALQHLPPVHPPILAATTRMDIDDLTADADDEDDFLESPPPPVAKAPAILRAASEPSNTSWSGESKSLQSISQLSSTAPAASMSHRNQHANSPRAGSKRPAPAAATVKHEYSPGHVFDLQLDGLEILDHQPKRVKIESSSSAVAAPAAAASSSSFSTAPLSSKRSHNTPAPKRFQQLPLEVISATKRSVPAATKKRVSPAASTKKTTPPRRGASKDVSPARAASVKEISPARRTSSREATPARSGPSQAAAASSPAAASSSSHVQDFHESKHSSPHHADALSLCADAPMDLVFDDDESAARVDVHVSEERKYPEESYPVLVGESVHERMDHEATSMYIPAHHAAASSIDLDESLLAQAVADRETIVMLDSLAMFFQDLPQQCPLTPKLLTQLHKLRVNLSHAKTLLRSHIADADEIAQLLESLDASLHSAFGGLLPSSISSRKSSRNKTATDQQIDHLISNIVDPLLAVHSHSHSQHGRSPQVKPMETMVKAEPSTVVAASAAAASSTTSSAVAIVPMDLAEPIPPPAAIVAAESTQAAPPREEPLAQVEPTPMDVIMM